MTLEEELERDIKQFFERIEGELPEGKEKILKFLVDKYCHISSSPILFDKNDFDMIKSHSQKFLIDKNFPKILGKNRRPIDSADNRVLAIIEGTISYLKSKDCLKKEPQFDYKE